MSHEPAKSATVIYNQPMFGAIDMKYVNHVMETAMRQHCTAQLVEPEYLQVRSVDLMTEHQSAKEQIISIRWVVTAVYPGNADSGPLMRRHEPWLVVLGAKVIEPDPSGGNKHEDPVPHVNRWGLAKVHVYGTDQRWSEATYYGHPQYEMFGSAVDLSHDQGEQWPDPLGTGMVHELT